MKLDVTKINFLFKKEWIDRIVTNEEENKITIDLHYLSCKDAEKLVKDTIALTSGSYIMEVIHGFNGGTALKQTMYNHTISNRITKRTSPAWNPGITEFAIAA